MHRLIALLATLLLSTSALAHAPRASVGALPFGEPTQAVQRIEDRQPERQAEAAAPEPHALEHATRQAKTAHRAHARRKHAESARISALTHCLVLEKWWLCEKAASGKSNPTVYVDPDGRYAEAGHYYTTLLAAKAAGYKDEQALRIALFAQLPDEIGKYDAVAQATGSMLMSRNRESRMYPGDPSRGVPDRMLSVKSDFNTPDQFSFQHNLAGLSADKALSKSRAAMAGARSMEGIGLAAHLMGDSFSHRTLKDESKMYDFPAGHAGDLTLPDVIAFRPALYREYVGTLVNALAERRGVPLSAEQSEAFVSSMMAMVEAPAAEARARESEVVAQDRWHSGSRMELPSTYSNLEREKIYRSADKKILASLKAAVSVQIAEGESGDIVLKPERANLSHWADLHDGPDQEQLTAFWEQAAERKLKEALSTSIYADAVSIDRVDEHVRTYLKDAKRGERP